MFTTAAQLLDLTDSTESPHALTIKRRRLIRAHVEKLILVLRDGRKITGVLRSWDQFGRIWEQRLEVRLVLTR